MKERKAFNFYRSFYDVFKELENETDKVKFITALCEKQFLGKEPDNLTGISKLAYLSQHQVINQQVLGWEMKTGVKLSDPTQGGSVGGTQGGSVQEKGEEKGEEKEKVQQGIAETESETIFFNNITYPKAHIHLCGKFMKQQNSVQTFMMQEKIKSENDLKSYIMQFLNHLNIEEKIYSESEYNNFKKHFLNWYRRVKPELEVSKKKQIDWFL